MAFHVFVGWRSHYEGHQSKEATKEFKIFFIGIVTTIVYKATWKAMKKKAFIWLLCLPTFLHLRTRPKTQDFFTWGWDQKTGKSPSILLCNEKKNQIFLHAVAIQAGQKFRSDLRRKRIFVIFNDCQYMLQNVDEIISQPFPVNRVFKGSLEAGFKDLGWWEMAGSQTPLVVQSGMQKKQWRTTLRTTLNPQAWKAKTRVNEYWEDSASS